MFDPVISFIYVLMIGIAFLCSLLSIRAGMPFHLRLLALLLGLTFLAELCVKYVFHLTENKLLYEVITLLEFWVYGYFFYQLIRIKAMRRIVFLFLWIFPIFWLTTILYLFKFDRWNTYVTVAGSFFCVLFALMYYYQLITAKEIQPFRNQPEFWIATGILMFNLWDLPFFGTLNFFMDYYTKHQTLTAYLLNSRLIVDTLMYAFFSYGFLCRIINIRKYSSS